MKTLAAMDEIAALLHAELAVGAQGTVIVIRNEENTECVFGSDDCAHRLPEAGKHAPPPQKTVDADRSIHERGIRRNPDAVDLAAGSSLNKRLHDRKPGSIGEVLCAEIADHPASANGYSYAGMPADLAELLFGIAEREKPVGSIGISQIAAEILLLQLQDTREISFRCPAVVYCIRHVSCLLSS